MMPDRLTRMLVALALACTLVACATSAEPVYYALASAPGTRNPKAIGSIEVRQPNIAGYLDRSEILTEIVNHRLRLASNERWGEPFAIMIGRVLAENLSERLPGSTVFTEASGMSIHASRLVELSIWKFDLDVDGYVRLKALLALRSDDAGVAAVTRTVSLQARPASEGLNGLVDAMSRLLGLLADEIAGSLDAGVGVSKEAPSQPVTQP
jgi:uncharacterized lipoprotein YmbA